MDYHIRRKNKFQNVFFYFSLNVKEWCLQLQRNSWILFENDRWEVTELRIFLMCLSTIGLYISSSEKVIYSFSCSQFWYFELVVDLHRYVGRKLLFYFVQHYEDLNENEQLPYNVFFVIHLVDDVNKFWAWDSFSAFKFENQFKKM